MIVKKAFWTVFSLACIACVTILLVEPNINQRKKKFKKHGMHKQTLVKKKYRSQDDFSPVQSSSSFVSQYYYKAKSLIKGTFSWGEAKHLSVCSFSVKALNTTRRDLKGLQAVVDILRKYDLIALQGVRNEKSLKSVVDGLSVYGPKYAYMISPWVGYGHKDRFVFVYRKDKCVLYKKGGSMCPKHHFLKKFLIMQALRPVILILR